MNEWIICMYLNLLATCYFFSFFCYYLFCLLRTSRLNWLTTRLFGKRRYVIRYYVYYRIDECDIYIVVYRGLRRTTTQKCRHTLYIRIQVVVVRGLLPGHAVAERRRPTVGFSSQSSEALSWFHVERYDAILYDGRTTVVRHRATLRRGLWSIDNAAASFTRDRYERATFLFPFYSSHTIDI